MLLLSSWEGILVAFAMVKDSNISSTEKRSRRRSEQRSNFLILHDRYMMYFALRRKRSQFPLNCIPTKFLTLSTHPFTIFLVVLQKGFSTTYTYTLPYTYLESFFLSWIYVLSLLRSDWLIANEISTST